MQTARRVPAASTRRALQIMSLFSLQRPILGVTEIAASLNVPKSNASRQVAALVGERLLARTPAGRYRLGLRLHELGELAARSHALYGPALSALIEVAKVTSESAQLAVLDGSAMTHLVRLSSADLAQATSGVWQRSPVHLHATSSGKVLLAFGPVEARDALLASGLPRLTAQTIVQPQAFLAELAAVRVNGYAVCREESAEGMSSLAVPIINRAGTAVAALAVIMPADRLTERRIKTLLVTLRRTAAALCEDYAFADDIYAAKRGRGRV